jgi:hypothetical protein
MNKRTRSFVNIFLVLSVIFVLGWLGYLLWSSSGSFVPKDFSEARGRSATIASELVSDLDTSLQNLNKISEEDKNGRYSSALELVEQETEKVEKVRNLALDLSNELINMTQAVQGIEPATARNLALEAITQEVPLIGHLTMYNDFLSRLLATLKMKFVDDSNYDSSDVQNYIAKMNEEAKSVNLINDSFDQKLKDFDKAL